MKGGANACGDPVPVHRELEEENHNETNLNFVHALPFLISVSSRIHNYGQGNAIKIPSKFNSKANCEVLGEAFPKMQPVIGWFIYGRRHEGGGKQQVDRSATTQP